MGDVPLDAGQVAGQITSFNLQELPAYFWHVMTGAAVHQEVFRAHWQWLQETHANTYQAVRHLCVDDHRYASTQVGGVPIKTIWTALVL